MTARRRAARSSTVERMEPHTRLPAAFLACCLLWVAAGAPPSPQAPSEQARPSAVPTFESLGLYWNRSQAPGECRVRYRAAGGGQWRDGYPLVYDAREKQYRGSLVELNADTEYEVELEAGGAKATLRARTWSERFPVGKTTELRGSTDRTLTISEGGTAQIGRAHV